MNKPERYILGVKEMKNLKELGLKIDEEDSLVYWVKFIQTQGQRKCHKWKLSIRSAAHLNRRCPQYGHYIGMPAYTLQQVLELLYIYDKDWVCTMPTTLKCAFNHLCEVVSSKKENHENQ